MNVNIDVRSLKTVCFPLEYYIIVNVTFKMAESRLVSIPLSPSSMHRSGLDLKAIVHAIRAKTYADTMYCT